MDWLNQYAGGISLGILSLIATVLMFRGNRDNKNVERTDSAWAGLRTDLANEKATVAILEDYAYELREHIEQKKSPPPPQWPAELRKRT